MFGNDHKNQDNDDVQPMSTQPVNNGLLGIDDDSDNNTSASTVPSAPPSPSPTPGGFSSDTYGDASQATPAAEPASEVHSAPPEPEPEHAVEPVSPEPSEPTPPVAPSTGTPSGNDDLLDIKKEALQELSPLIDHLEQNSEEKFRTTMMMIQASDNKTLIPQAFKAAREISDDKKRAQALLDIVNEINYFTHKNED